VCSVFAVTPVLRLVLVSVPLGGSARALAMVLSGDDFDIPLLSPLEMRRVQRTFDSPFALLPSTFAWGKNDTLIFTPSRNFSTSDIDELLRLAHVQATFAPASDAKEASDPPCVEESRDETDMGHADPSSEKYSADAMLRHASRVGHLTERLQKKGPPRVPVSCLFSYGVPTPGKYGYGDGERSFDTPLQVDIDDGDGTVSLRSLRLCEDWKRRLKGRLVVSPFENVSHFNMMRDSRVVNSILEQLQQDVTKECSDQSCGDVTGWFSAYWFLYRWRWTQWRHRWGWLPRSALRSIAKKSFDLSIRFFEDASRLLSNPSSWLRQSPPKETGANGDL